MSNSKTPLIYLPARVVAGKEVYITFSAPDHTGQLKRKRIKLNRFPTRKEARSVGEKMCREINQKLTNGWNPWLEQEVSHGYELIVDMIARFLKMKERENLRPDSMRTYRSQSIKLTRWLIGRKIEKMPVSAFNSHHATDFMNQLFLDNEIETATWNNSLAFFRTLWYFFIEQKTAKANPFITIRKKRQKRKKREIIAVEDRERILQYLEATDYRFFVVCLLQYYCFIRPREICHLIAPYFNLEKNSIYLPPEITKTNKGTNKTVPDVLMPHLERIISEAPNDSYFLFSYFNLEPGSEINDSRYLGKRWDRLKKELDLKNEYQFYSWKDTGVVNMINAGISTKAIMHQCNHSSLDFTTIYADHLEPEADRQLREWK